MNTNYFRSLTKQDKKTLSQTALKVSEEAGELAKVVLPFDSASGTVHRFVDKQRILEEVADLYLTAMSVAYKLDFTDDEIEDMIMLKAGKWAAIQQAEAKATDNIPYEIHVTVAEANRTLFKEHCHTLGVKPVFLALQTQSNDLKDVMTSSVYVGNNRGAYDEMKRIADGLRTFGYEVLREKIETAPWHPAAPTSKNNAPMPLNCYFETHIGVVVPDDEGSKRRLNELALRYNAHLSRNVFKQRSDGSYVQMITYRVYDGTAEKFEQVAVELEKDLRKSFEVEKRVTEFSIYDTKVSHDAAWLKS